MQELVLDNGHVDPFVFRDASMNDDKITEIMVRLERLDAGQRYVIDQLGGMQADIRAEQATVDRLQTQVSKLEWSAATREQHLRPWRHFALTVGASAVTAIG